MTEKLRCVEAFARTYSCHVMNVFNISALLNHLLCVRLMLAQKQLIFVGLPSVIFTAEKKCCCNSFHSHSCSHVCAAFNTSRNARKCKKIYRWKHRLGWVCPQEIWIASVPNWLGQQKRKTYCINEIIILLMKSNILDARDFYLLWNTKPEKYHSYLSR